MHKASVEELLQWMYEVLEKEMTVFEENYWTDEITKVATQFLNDRNIVRLFFWGEEDGMRYTFMEPPLLSVEKSFDSEFMFFVKVNAENSGRYTL